MRVDLVLSSGFLAFARHAGFLAAVEARGLTVDAVCGTSSGAVTAALWAAGMSASEITALFARTSLMRLARPNPALWRGAFLLGGFVDFLRPHLPARFEDLRRPFAVGVIDRSGAHRLLMEGPLPEAVAASCAMPWIFSAVPVDGTRYADGGAADRLGLDAFRRWRPAGRVVAHWVDRTAGKDVECSLEDVVVVRTPRSGARFWNLGDVAAQMEEARDLSVQALERALPSAPAREQPAGS